MNAISNISAPSISSAAMLVELSISCWVGRKKDKSASKDVTSRNGADEDVAHVSKKLLADCDELKAVQGWAANTRTRHYSLTMPWSNTGLRLLPTAAYFDYHRELTDRQTKFYEAVNEFIDAYQFEVGRAQMKLGNLFNPDDYPTAESLRGKFAFHINYMPLPSSGDFRVDVGNEQQRVLAEEYDKFFTAQLERAMGDVWGRTYEALAKMSERLDYSGKEDRKIFRDSLVDNVMDMVDLLKTCNVTGDPVMEEMRGKLVRALKGITPDALRNNESLRLSTKREVDAAIAAIPSLGDW